MQTAQPDGKQRCDVATNGLAWKDEACGRGLRSGVWGGWGKSVWWSTLDYAATAIDDGHRKGVGRQLVPLHSFPARSKNESTLVLDMNEPWSTLAQTYLYHYQGITVIPLPF